MTIAIRQQTILSPVAPAATIFFAYPAGFTQSQFTGDFASATAILVLDNTAVLRQAAGAIAVSYGASGATVTNNTTFSWGTGTLAALQMAGLAPGGGGSSVVVGVSTVNGQAGAVNLTAADVGARPIGVNIPQAEVTGLGTALSGKADAGHTHGTFTSIASGFAPASGGGTANFLRADGVWVAPPTGTVTPPGEPAPIDPDLEAVAELFAGGPFPTVPASGAGVAAGTDDLAVVTPAALRDSEATLLKGSISGAVIPDLSGSTSASFTITAATTVSAFTGMALDRTYTVRFVGGASGPHNLTLGDYVLIPTGLSIPVSVGTGATFVVRVQAVLATDGAIRFEVLSHALIAAPAAIVPAVISAEVYPFDARPGDRVFYVADVVGRPAPTIASQFVLNGDDVPGATDPEQVLPAGFAGSFGFDLTPSNGTGSPAVFKVRSRVGRPQPTFVAERFLPLHELDSPTTATVNIELPTSPALVADEDTAVLIHVHRLDVEKTLPARFSRVGFDIIRPGAVTGDNFSLGVAWTEITAADITAGNLGTFTVNSHFASTLLVVRNLGGLAFNEASDEIRTAANVASSVAIPQSTTVDPALHIAIGASSSYNLQMKTATMTGWTAGLDVTFSFNNSARVGVKAFRRLVGSGQIPAGTMTGTGSANATWLAANLFLYGKGA
jgi:hypothetical protein